MGKEQVSGSLTLSLGGLADEVAGEVVTRLASTLRELARPEPIVPWTQNQAVGLLTGVGLTYDQALAVYQNMTEYGLGVVRIVPEEDPEQVPPAPEPESAVAWFEREVDGR